TRAKLQVSYLVESARHRPIARLAQPFQLTRGAPCFRKALKFNENCQKWRCFIASSCGPGHCWVQRRPRKTCRNPCFAVTRGFARVLHCATTRALCDHLKVCECHSVGHRCRATTSTSMVPTQGGRREASSGCRAARR